MDRERTAGHDRNVGSHARGEAADDDPLDAFAGVLDRGEHLGAGEHVAARRVDLDLDRLAVRGERVGERRAKPRDGRDHAGLDVGREKRMVEPGVDDGAADLDGGHCSGSCCAGAAAAAPGVIS